MSASNMEAIMIVFHIGSSKKLNKYEVMNFFTEAKDCIFKILLRKILCDSKDLVSVAIAGSECTENDLAGEGEYQNIDVICPFVYSNWDLVERVLSIQPTEIYVNWLDAMIVGIQCLRDKIEEYEQLKKVKNKITKKKLVLLSSFTDDVPDDQVDSVVEGLKDLGIELVVIGPDILKTESDICDLDFESSVEKRLTKSQQLIIKICNEVSDQGTLCICSEALKQLKYFTNKKSKRMPWNVNMSVGPDISVPIVGFKMLVNQQLVKWDKCTVDHEPVRTDYSFFSGENEVDREDRISGYLFGSSIVPFSDHDEAASKYDSGERGLSILFTVPYDEVKMHLFMGQSTYYIMGRKGNQKAEKAISAFADALSQSNLVAIARKVYCKSGTVTIGALYPKADVSTFALVYVELPFKHEINKLWFPSLSDISVNDEQLNAVNMLMDSMDLSHFDEDDDPYKPEKLYDPYEQYLLHCISVKGLQGTQMYSKSEAFEVPEFIKNLLLPLPEVVKKSASALEEIKKEFPLEIIERKTSLKSENHEINIKKEEQNENGEAEENDSCLDNGNVTDFLHASVIMVGTVNPESDFTILLGKGEKFEKVCEQMQKVIIDLLRRVDNLEMMKKPLLCLNLLRKSCIEKKQSDVYNDWMKKLKEVVIDVRQQDLWNKITDDNLGLITIEEDCSSSVLTVNAIEFLKYNLDDALRDEEMDIAAMLDDI